MKIEIRTPMGEKIKIEETPGGIYGSRLKFIIYRGNECETFFEIYMKDFEKIARALLNIPTRKKK